MDYELFGYTFELWSMLTGAVVVALVATVLHHFSTRRRKKRLPENNISLLRAEIEESYAKLKEVANTMQKLHNIFADVEEMQKA